MRSVYKLVIWWRRSSVHQNQRSKSYQRTSKPRLAAYAKGRREESGESMEQALSTAAPRAGPTGAPGPHAEHAAQRQRQRRVRVLQFMGTVGPFRWLIYNPRFLQRAWGTSGDGHLGTGVFYRTSTKEVPKFVT